MDVFTAVTTMSLLSSSSLNWKEEGLNSPISNASATDPDDTDEDPLKDFEPLAHALVYAVAKDESHEEIEVMPESDVPKVRVHLKESFSGIPLPPPTANKNRQKKIDKSHAHYRLAVGMMTGIREAVGGVDGLLEAEYEEQDFHSMTLSKECRRNRKYSFQSNSPQNDEFEFKAYAPIVFARIRSHNGIDKNLFLHSVCGNFQYLEFMSNAKSSSFFFFSHDGRYLIKTLSMEECHFLVKILPNYYQYIVHNPESFLTRFYGLYRVQMSDQTIYFTIMRSVFDTQLQMTHTFDLKGSTLGREAKVSESVKKDLDIIKEDRKLDLSPVVQDLILRQIKRDSTLLSRLGIMDYSFLLGIHERSNIEGESYIIEPDQNAQIDLILQESDSQNEHDFLIDDEVLRKIGEGRTSHHEDEYVNWGNTCILPCMDECSVNTSFAESVFGPSFTPSVWADSLGYDSTCPISTRSDGGIESSDGKCLYYAGIIDILQPYNTLKWGETVVKKVQGNAEHEISCVDPETYSNRFLKFLTKILMN
jgi:1-phosphatidylinositol-4-phosphate 5-kinase